MARIAGVNIPDNKHTVISLTYIYGVGRTQAQNICAATGVNPAAKSKELSDEQIAAITEWVRLGAPRPETPADRMRRRRTKTRAPSSRSPNGCANRG